MASFFLSWNPYGTNDQTIQYKLHSDSDWTDYVTVSFAIDSYLISDLDSDLVYDFRVATDCEETTRYTNIVTAISFTCPTVTTSSTDVEISYSFSPVEGDLTSYVVQLIKAGNVVTYDTYNAPFDDPIEGSFTVAISDGTYSIRLVPTSGDYSTNCLTTPSIIPVCVEITDITGTITY